MTRRSLSALIVLNVVLLAGLALSVLSPQPAQAQLGGSANYLMISGEIVGRAQQNGIYVVDLTTSKLVAMIYNTANNKLMVIDGRIIADDVARAAGQR